MPILSLPRAAAPAVLVAAVLAACGGGGDGAPPRQPKADAPRVLISDANAAAVAAQALNANAGGVGLVGDGRGALPAAQEPGDGGTPKPTARRVLLKALHGAARRAPGVGIQATGTDVIECAFSGTIVTTTTISGDVVAAGDTQVIEHRNCNDGLVTTNGRITDVTTRVEFSADGLLTEHELNVAGYTVSTGGVVDRLDGLMRNTTFIDTGLTEARTDFTSERFVEERIVDGVSRAFREVTELDHDSRFPVATGQWIQELSFTSSGEFAGLGEASFEFETLEPLVLEDGEIEPSAGRFRVTGEGNTSITVTLQGSDVTIEVDGDGDGTVDSTLTQTTQDLAALL